MQLSVKDVASYLGVSEKTIYRWIKQKKIPVYRINEQCRFNRAEIIEWATAERIPFQPSLLAEDAAEALPGLVAALQNGSIVYRLEGGDKAAVLRNIVDVMQLQDEVDREFLYEVLLAREDLGSTGVGDGIAIPHVRNPIVLHVAKPIVTLCFLENPIPYDALDGRPVDTLFTIVTPTVRTHLHLLSRLGFALRDPGFHTALRKQDTRANIIAALEAAESALVDET